VLSLEARVRLLQRKCVDALGEARFEQARALLRERRGQGLRPGKPEWAQLEAIVGEGNLDYCAVLEQLVFIEDLSGQR
jgi:hypothetical protein